MIFMYLKLEYIEQPDGICICRCYGYEDVLILPEEVLGKPVTALYDYALSSSRPWKEPDEVKQVTLHEEERGFTEETELSGEFLREVFLPKSLKRIGDYAFYLCRNLHTLHIQRNLDAMGGGVFVWCRSLSLLTFSGVSYDHHGINGVLSELTQELETEITYEDGTSLRLTFPEYYEESVENTPARIIDIHWHGSGYKYRQCFPETKLDLKRYDELFPYAVANEFVPTCVRIALNRLMTPVQLTEKAKESYLIFLLEHMEEILTEAVRLEDLEQVRFLSEQEIHGQRLLGKEAADRAVDEASRRESAELASFLMDYRREHFRSRRKTFEL